MSQKISVKISQRHDTLENWTAADPVLIDGELIAVECADTVKFKLGDGTKKFSQLGYVDAEAIESQRARIGTSVAATGAGSFAAGYSVNAAGDFSQALGYKVEVSDAQAFAWNGYTGNTYASKGQGTFAINPVNGLSGVYIGRLSLYDWIFNTDYSNLASQAQEAWSLMNTCVRSCLDMSAALDKKVYVDGISAQSLSVQNISRDDYRQKVLDGTVLSNVVYVVSAETASFYGEKLENVADGTKATDAATFGQVSAVEAKLSAVDAGLSDYVKLSAMSSYAEASSMSQYAAASSLADYAEKSSLPYQLVSADLVSTGTGLSCQAKNRAITTISLSSSADPLTVRLPELAYVGKTYLARDFLLRIEISSDSVPTVSFANYDASETLVFESDDDSWAVLEPGVNLMSFTETKFEDQQIYFVVMRKVLAQTT